LTPPLPAIKVRPAILSGGIRRSKASCGPSSRLAGPGSLSGKLAEGGKVRRHGKVDANQTQIIAALRKAGCSVQSLADLGGGAPDLLVGLGGDNYLLECKDGGKPPSARALTPDQVRWHAAWGGTVEVVESVEQALRAVGLRQPLADIVLSDRRAAPEG
jgi:hypothetical protein